MAQTTRPILRKGQTIPDFTLNDVDGNQVSSREFYLRRNLVIAMLPDQVNDSWQEWISQLSRVAGELPDGDAAMLVIVPDGQSIHAETINLTLLLDPDRRIRERFGVDSSEGMLVVADRYGVVFYAATDKASDPALDPEGIPGWVEFVVCRCS